MSGVGTFVCVCVFVCVSTRVHLHHVFACMFVCPPAGSTVGFAHFDLGVPGLCAGVPGYLARHDCILRQLQCVLLYLCLFVCMCMLACVCMCIWVCVLFTYMCVPTYG